VDTLAVNILSPQSLIQAFGLIGVLLIIFAETGLLIGFFLPGDTLLFLAGVVAAGAIKHLELPIAGLLIGTPVFAIAGAQVGHWLGSNVGRRLFNRPDSRLFRREHVDKAEYYFLKYGPAKAVVLARFVPIVRTFLNPVAGILEMPARTFFLWNVIGGILWTESVVLLGYKLGGSLSHSFNIDKYILPAAALLFVLSVLPMVFEVMRSRRSNQDNKVSDHV
jgi:membrane-associated protein